MSSAPAAPVMLSSLLLILLPAAAGVVGSTAVPVVQQVPDLKERIATYTDHLKSREEDSSAHAIAMIDDFGMEYLAKTARVEEIEAGLEAGTVEKGPAKSELKELRKEQELIADAVHLALSHSRRKKVTQDNKRLWTAAAHGLALMGSLGAERLLEAFEDKKRFGDEPELRGLFIERIGASLAYEYTEELIDLLDHSEFLFIARAADALAHFADAPGKLRKEAVGKLARLLSEYYDMYQTAERAATVPGGDTPANKIARDQARKKYRRVAEPMTVALEALTGVSAGGPDEWARWFNKHKNDKERWAN